MTHTLMKIECAFDARRSAMLVVLAALALVLGIGVYLTDRPPSHATLVPSIGWSAGRHLFGALGGWLPSFVHPFAFSLLTAVTLPAVPTLRYGACAVWCGVNLAFELGQHPGCRARLAATLHAAFDRLGLGQPLANYFLRGTFDVGDIVAVLLGAGAAAGLLVLSAHGTEPGHAN